MCRLSACFHSVRPFVKIASSASIQPRCSTNRRPRTETPVTRSRCLKNEPRLNTLRMLGWQNIPWGYRLHEKKNNLFSNAVSSNIFNYSWSTFFRTREVLSGIPSALTVKWRALFSEKVRSQKNDSETSLECHLTLAPPRCLQRQDGDLRLSQ